MATAAAKLGERGVSSTDFSASPTTAGDSGAQPRTFELVLTPPADGGSGGDASRVRVTYAAASLAGCDPRPPTAPPTGPGPVKANQDAWIAHENAGGGESLLLGVLDGHGVDGGRVSAAAASRLPRLAADAGLGRTDAGAAAGGLAKLKNASAPGGGWPGVRGPPSADVAKRRGSGSGGGGGGGGATAAPAWPRGAGSGPPADDPAPPCSTEDDDEDASSGGAGTPLASGSAGSGGTDGAGGSGGSGSMPSLASDAAAAAGGGGDGESLPSHHHHHHHHHPTAVSSRPSRAAGGVLALDAALARAHACVLAAPGIDCTLSGSTAALAALDADGLALAHVGDSRILLGRLDPAAPDAAAPGALLPALALTDDHTPGRPDEARRILAHRGRIGSYTHCGAPVGPLRVWLPHADAPGLCMTRALGDTVAAAAGVTARAETGARRLERGDRYLVLLSDGVHEFWSNDAIMATVHAVAGAGGSPADAAAALVRVARGQWEAAEAGAADDCTAVVAFLEVE